MLEVMHTLTFNRAAADGVLFTFEPDYPLASLAIQWIGEARGDMEISEMLFVGVIVTNHDAFRTSWLPYVQGITFENPFDVKRTACGAPPGLVEQIDMATARCRTATHHDLLKLKIAQDLHWLNIADGDVGDESLVTLEELPYLQSLDLSGTRVTDRGMCLLKEHIGLQELQLNSTAVTDDGLRVIADALPNLQVLGLRNTVISASALAEFAARFPHCKIEQH
jgi:hypothetical protein